MRSAEARHAEERGEQLCETSKSSTTTSLGLADDDVVEREWRLLPPELLDKVLDYGGPVARCVAASTCRDWREAIVSGGNGSGTLRWTKQMEEWMRSEFYTRRWRMCGRSRVSDSSNGSFKKLTKHKHWVTGVVLNKNTILSCSYDQSLISWERNTGRWQKVVSTNHSAPITCMAASETNKGPCEKH